MEPPKSSFEKAFRSLQAIVERLETEELSLEETVDLYEQAMELARVANRMLDEAEMKVKVLAQQRDGTFVPVDLDLDQPV